MKEKILNKTWKKILLIFFIIFSLVLIGGMVSVDVLHHAIVNDNIHPEIIIVDDKIHKNHKYFIIGDNERTYTIDNDKYGRTLFNKIEVGQEYKAIVKEPNVTDIDEHVYIMQVYNVTG